MEGLKMDEAGEDTEELIAWSLEPGTLSALSSPGASAHRSGDKIR